MKNIKLSKIYNFFNKCKDYAKKNFYTATLVLYIFLVGFWTILFLQGSYLIAQNPKAFLFVSRLLVILSLVYVYLKKSKKMPKHQKYLEWVGFGVTLALAIVQEVILLQNSRK